ncbi:MAG TPA: protoheme IX farnesyltransferase, partial [Leptospiraceae bacterium]|nr:protoheme IX farnesyltransferase [Leptospiraceae bacterium]
MVFLKELALLTKPNVLVMNALMTLGGLAMASRMDVSLGLKTMVGTVLAIAAAGTLNMYLERDADGLMKRTADRPLPAHRIGASVALISGLAMSTLSILELYFLVNPLTCLLAIAALLIYVCVYTPMKYKSPVALHVGSIAGAIPPLMGWTAARNEIQVGGLVLFAILYFWQLPHVTAISIYRD